MESASPRKGVNGSPDQLLRKSLLKIEPPMPREAVI
jgi:hypothetical protein